jgi:hypothetical protein
MTFPYIRLAQKNITKFKGRNITQFLIFEWIYVIRQMALLDDAKFAPLANPSNGAGL